VFNNRLDGSQTKVRDAFSEEFRVVFEVSFEGFVAQEAEDVGL